MPEQKLAGSKTEANLRAAFAEECRARMLYTFYAGKARQDGFEQIGEIFEETAANEREHAEIWYQLLHGGPFDATQENLRDAAGVEQHEWTDLYADYAKTARDEGFEWIAQLFENVGAIEREHEARFRKLISNLEDGLVFSRDGDAIWQCGNCGHIVVGPKAPETCPVCGHPQAYFRLKAENF